MPNVYAGHRRSWAWEDLNLRPHPYQLSRFDTPWPASCTCRWYRSGGGRLRGRRLADLVFSTMPKMADNCVHVEGGAMPRLDDTAVEEGLQRLPGWERRGNQIAKTFVREDFAHAMVFVNEVASAAEAAGHHPDIDIRWNTVTLALSSHDEGGLTDRDFQLAARIQELDQPTQPA
jgi:4a-hydroxytetrahydrobiopterin dehydratase